MVTPPKPYDDASCPNASSWPSGDGVFRTGGESVGASSRFLDRGDTDEEFLGFEGF